MIFFKSNHASGVCWFFNIVWMVSMLFNSSQKVEEEKNNIPTLYGFLT